jgi:hypothetical protein
MKRALLLLAICVVGCGAPAKFSEVQEKVFTPSCVFSSCHSGSNPAGSLNLEAGKAYAQLVDAVSKDAPGHTRVVAGDTKTSYLYEKLTSTQPAAGVRMPQGGDALEADRLEMVRSWITNGAKND